MGDRLRHGYAAIWPPAAAFLTLVALLGGLFLVLSILSQSRNHRLRPAHGPHAFAPVLSAVVPALLLVAAAFAAVALVLG